LTAQDKISVDKYWKYALWLALFTIIYNFAEGIVSIIFGVHDETLTLFSFGIDSFIEVVSGLGILAMVIRFRQNLNTPRSHFERTALQITGTSFYLLALGLGATSICNLFTAHKPATAIPDIIISLISISVMWAVAFSKRKVGHALNSSTILADANCTWFVCAKSQLDSLVATADRRRGGGLHSLQRSWLSHSPGAGDRGGGGRAF